MTNKRLWICGALVALLAMGAAADERANAPTVTGETGLFTLFTGETIPQGDLSFGIYYNNWDRVFEFDSTADLDWHRVSASLGYGVTDAWEISIMVPWEQFNPDFPGEDTTESGIGNARLGSKWKVFSDDTSSFAINAFVELPTGDDNVLGGDTGFGAGIAYRKSNWVMNLGYRVPGDIGPGNGVDLSDEILAGIGYTSSVSETFDWIWELNGTFPTDNDKALFEESVDLVGGGRYWFDAEGPWAFNFALRTDVLQLSETDDHCPIGGLLGFTYFPRLFSLPEPPPPPPPPAEYELTVEKRGNCAAGGTVTSNPAGIDCGADCAATYVEGTAVTLTAREGDGCTFDGWTGDADCADGSVTMNGDRMCVANFSEIPAPPPAPPKMTEVERTCVFDSASARVNNACKAILDEVALLMKDNPEAPALVIGYSDSQGSEASNTRTGQRRAESVKNWLVTRHAIDPSRITVESRGEADPVGDNATAAGRKANRRAVIRITVEEDMM